jgi:hypothetical protein
MIWLLTRPIVWPVKTAAYSAAAGYKTGRTIGLRRLTVFGLGIGVGLLLAPTPGRELRAKLKERISPEPPLPLPTGTGGPYPVAIPDQAPVATDLAE